MASLRNQYVKAGIVVDAILCLQTAISAKHQPDVTTSKPKMFSCVGGNFNICLSTDSQTKAYYESKLKFSLQTLLLKVHINGVLISSQRGTEARN